jgi:hypothetical protein
VIIVLAVLVYMFIAVLVSKLVRKASWEEHELHVLCGALWPLSVPIIASCYLLMCFDKLITKATGGRL